MSRFFKYVSGASRQILIARKLKTKTALIPSILNIPYIPNTDKTVALFSFSHFCRSYCSGNDTGNGNGEEKLDSDSSKEAPSPDVNNLPTGSDEIKILASELVQDVETKELLEELKKFWGGKEDNLEKIAEMVLRRAASEKHEESDEEIMETLRMRPVEDVEDSEFESDFDELHEVDTDIDNLYNATEYTEENLLPDESKEMTAEQWDGIMEEYQEYQNAKEKGKSYEQQSLEEYVENMANKLLPEDIKQEIEAKFDELCERCKSGEVGPEATNALFKEFEEKMVEEYAKRGNVNNNDFKKYPSGKGPILRWETRVVLAPGGNAFHPKNRRVKVSISVKELGLSKYAAKRLRAMVGKRYDIGKDELTIVGRRFENREENRKDVLRILYALIEEAQKADVYVREAHTAVMKDHLKNNPEFQNRLRVQTAMLRGSEGPSFV